MAVDDVVRTIRDIRTFDPDTLKIRDDGIPQGSLGIVILQDDANGFVSVEFEFIRKGLQKITKVIGIFGENVVDTIVNSLEFITVEPPPGLLESIRQESVTGLESRDDLALQLEEKLLPGVVRTSIGDLVQLSGVRQKVGELVPAGLTPSDEFSNSFTLAFNTALPSGFEFIPGSRNNDQVRRIISGQQV